jgi:leucyl/phenylalanyl-tRNA--protein transferase
MTALKWIPKDAEPALLPDARLAMQHPNGLVAAGGRLSPDWLLHAYRHGIFPWYEEGQPILWWSPDPRAVLWPDRLHLSRSLRKTVRRARFEISSDRAFRSVVEACAEPRSYTDATWITAEMARAYTRLYRLGWAHSFEAWQNGELVGGLYGVAIGRVFFGESMFSRVSDSSKVAFAAAVPYLAQLGIELIDCQISSTHLTSLGATDIDRVRFLGLLDQLCEPVELPRPWPKSVDVPIDRCT